MPNAQLRRTTDARRERTSCHVQLEASHARRACWLDTSVSLMTKSLAATRPMATCGVGRVRVQARRRVRSI
jgi:hypothetical protein